jgi:hypothetical protein
VSAAPRGPAQPEAALGGVELNLGQPRLLREEVRRLAVRAQSRGERSRSDADRLATEAIRSWTPGEALSPVALRGLVARYAAAASAPTPDIDRIETILRPHLDRLRLGQLLGLWQLAGRHLALVAPALGAEVERRKVEQRQATVRREKLDETSETLGVPPRDLTAAVPGFILRASSPRVYDDPVPWLADDIAARRLPLVELGAHEADLGVVMSLGVGLAAVGHVIRTGDAGWWRLSEPAAVRAWAEGRALGLQQAVVERALTDLGGAAENPAQILDPRSAETRTWMRWCRQLLGEPEVAVGAWSGVSPRARQIYEWLALISEFDKILEEFRRNSEDRDRAEFWLKWLHALTDARFFKDADGVAICIMGFGPLVVIEFGTVGNAAYVYRWAEAPLSLRTFRLSRDLRASDFKDKVALRLGAARVKLDHKGRILHTRVNGGPAWFEAAEDLLTRLGVAERQT